MIYKTLRVTRSLVLYACFVGRCLSFCIFLLAIVLSVRLRYTDYDFPFGIFKLLLSHNVVSSRPRLSGVRTHNCSGDGNHNPYIEEEQTT
jgi:hypothetical protein